MRTLEEIPNPKSQNPNPNPKRLETSVGIWNLGCGLRDFVLLALVIVAASTSSGCSYNRFVSQEEAIKTQWAQVENQLQRRNDLIPNLVETTKGIAQQEKDVFGQIADSRAKLAGARTPEETIQAANQQSAALARLLVVVENYPQLRSSETFNRLMDELSGTENRIAVERMRYNERVQEYNTARRQFPANITASLFGFKEYPLFNAPTAAEQVPKVNFGKGTN
jgi:LemA protein